MEADDWAFVDALVFLELPSSALVALADDCSDPELADVLRREADGRAALEEFEI